MFRNCRTCREGHRKCDRARPVCRTCWKNGFHCKGYDRDGQMVFVNVDSSTIESSSKIILSEALSRVANVSSSWTSHSQHPAENLHRNSLNSLELTKLDFRNHVMCLWDHFNIGHSCSSDAWAPSFTTLINRNRFLDLALIALSSLRLSQTTRDKQARIMSLTAYGESLRLFRSCCENGQITRNPHLIATLATASLVYTMFEAMHHTPSTIFSSGVMFQNRHLQGAILFMQLCGPQTFAARDDHLVFKKLREMVILDSFCACQKSFLAEPHWMNEPWLNAPKTTRDRLFDIAALLTGPVAYALAHNRASVGAGASEDMSESLETLEASLDSWYASWHRNLLDEISATVLQFQHDPGSIDIAFDANRSELDAVFLQVEYWSLRLLLQLCSICGAKGNLHSCPASSDYNGITSFINGCNELARKLKQGLRQPVYGQKIVRGEGITEGQCRSLLPAWALMTYDRHCERYASCEGHPGGKLASDAFARN
ncbi:hypothetical protein EDB81DRAFT_801178 [Dactylonectria macrodidyma]|uniref:Zn(2)-C6 fungal-type domain-containing protein n=1 Tax=Dactylonectria macrodidyma TaxID=307937 RepID=A0A9P9IW70_9HYPO|nr:hypothetical protein EDB81DRAFT_801178 [Dactylonectria macrodidyma]